MASACKKIVSYKGPILHTRKYWHLAARNAKRSTILRKIGDKGQSRKSHDHVVKPRAPGEWFH